LPALITLPGNIKHAPEWMKNMALEWLYRLIQEPKRLWKRYLVTNTLFLFYVFLELIGLRKFD
jgi:N-acetylglucosaminyldiphosphoundecaprenol N-acetyl-beta-D-mannosaminyltransferase